MPLTRKLVIYDRVRIPKSLKSNLAIRNVKVIRKKVSTKSKSPMSRIILSGYDGKIKYSSSRKVTARTIKHIITKIDVMPIGVIEKKIRDAR